MLLPTQRDIISGCTTVAAQFERHDSVCGVLSAATRQEIAAA